MGIGSLRKECSGLEEAIENRISDFGAAYMAVRDLNSLVCNHPEVISSRTVSVLGTVLGGGEHASQKLALFFYKEAADALAAISVHENIEGNMALQAIAALKSAVVGGGCHAQRAAAEAMGSLPLLVRGPAIDDEPPENPPYVTWDEIRAEAGVRADMAPVMKGRSLVVPAHEKNGLLVVKLNRAKESPRAMYGEAAWMMHLQPGRCSFPVRFDVPSPLKIRGSYLFRARDVPVEPKMQKGLDPEGHAIGFIAHKDYFMYVNDHIRKAGFEGNDFKEVMARNAWLLGKTASRGIVHSAPIPLFHNRVQTNRRADQGLYEWPRGGRLDRWLYSCRHPNFGPTGLRDFEHFAPFRGRSKELYEQVGSHFLSLLLVTGSYFRNKNPERVGYDFQGQPVDARDLFHTPLLEEIIHAVFRAYYHGFVGIEHEGNPPFKCETLSSRMVEEMGVDRHMEEILRAADQQNMTDAEFRRFLADRGYSAAKIEALQRGAEDISIHTGPHLGGFNQRISLPELIEFVEAASAVCIADKYLRDKKSA